MGKNLKNNSKNLKKSKNPFRLVGVLFFLSIAALVIFKIYFFDETLRSFASQQATKKNRAKVDLAKIKTSVTEGFFQAQGIEWTDPQQTMQNIFSIKDTVFKINYFPLLQKKINIKEIKIDQFGIKTPRTTDGKIEQKKVEIKKSPLQEKKYFLEKKSEEKLGQAQKKIDSITQKALAEIKIKETALKSQAKTLEKKYRKNWETIQKNANLEKEIKEINSLNLKVNSPQDLERIYRNIKNLERVNKKIIQLENSLKPLKEDIEKDKKVLTRQINDLKNIEKEGLELINKAVGFNLTSQRAWTKELIGAELTDKLYRGIALYKKYKFLLPQPKSREEKLAEEELEKMQTSLRKGRNITFPTQGKLPKFLVEKIIFSSVEEKNKKEKNKIISGEILNLSSDLTFKTIKNNLKIRLGGINLSQTGLIEKKDGSYHLLQNIDSNYFSIEKYLQFQKNPFILGMREGKAKIIAFLEDENNLLKLKFELKAKNISFKINPLANPTIKPVLQSILKKIPALEIKILYEEVLEGEKQQPKIVITSNLDKILSTRLSGYFNKLVKEKKKESLAIFKKQVSPIIDKTRNEILGELKLDDLKKYQKQLSDYNKIIEKNRQKANQAIKDYQKKNLDIKKLDINKLKKSLF